ncbi:MAG: RlpA-like double-psi beta-barrel-protein domain-containing protein-containing protein [Benjaminiella poitrasii]|nr:MAG: RlpA-like double-psi beta-barrel-protein domain-containing protein-containing protein [Benjaminiella poitrasii]
MPRTFPLLTIAIAALGSLAAAAPIDINSISPIESTSKNKKSSSSSSSSGTYSGTATWFKPASEGGSEGACGPEENDNSRIVALNAPQYGDMDEKSSWCGKKISITGPAGTATATINDACPECGKGDLDLTPVLFKKIVGDMNIGVGKITWSVV